MDIDHVRGLIIKELTDTITKQEKHYLNYLIETNQQVQRLWNQLREMQSRIDDLIFLSAKQIMEEAEKRKQQESWWDLFFENISRSYN